MKKILTLSVLGFMFINLYSQRTEDVVYLNNGSIIRGAIIENSSEQIKIKSCCNNVFVFKQSEIQNIAKEAKIPELTLKEFGYFNFTSIGTLFGSSLNEKPAPFSFLMEHNLRINKYFAIGAATGLEMLYETTCPLGGNVKFLLPVNNGNTYFAGTSFGYSVSLDKPNYMEYYEIIEANGGYMFNAELGVAYPLKNDVGFFVAAGFRYNELNYKRNDWSYQSVERNMYYNRISLRLGICFY